MGNAGKFVERERARQLRAQAWTLQAIATELGVAKGTVSVWVRDLEFTPKPRNRGHAGCKPHPLQLRKQAEIEACRADAEVLIGDVTDRDRLMYSLALYAGEGAKIPELVRVFLSWLRRQFEIDEHRLRVRLYLHADLDLDHALQFWGGVTAIPVAQFNAPYRAVADATRRGNRHVHGCVSVVYSSSLVHRRVVAMIAAVTSRLANPG